MALFFPGHDTDVLHPVLPVLPMVCCLLSLPLIPGPAESLFVRRSARLAVKSSFREECRGFIWTGQGVNLERIVLLLIFIVLIIKARIEQNICNAPSVNFMWVILEEGCLLLLCCFSKRKQTASRRFFTSSSFFFCELHFSVLFYQDLESYTHFQ